LFLFKQTGQFRSADRSAAIHLPGEDYERNHSFVTAQSQRLAALMTCKPQLKPLFILRSILQSVQPGVLCSMFQTPNKRKAECSDKPSGKRQCSLARSANSYSPLDDTEPPSFLTAICETTCKYLDNVAFNYIKLREDCGGSGCVLYDALYKSRPSQPEISCLDTGIDKTLSASSPVSEVCLDPAAFAEQLNQLVPLPEKTKKVRGKYLCPLTRICKYINPQDYSHQDDEDTEDVNMDDAARKSQVKLLVEDRFTLQLLDELHILIDSLHARLTDPKTPGSEKHKESCMFKLLVTVLFATICRRPSSLSLLDRPENRRYRNWVMSAFFRCVLRPVTTGPDAEIITLSKVGLARLDAKQKKIPRDVVDSVLRPALVQFCDIQKLDMPLIVGLHSVVELFPTLFKEVFGKRILETLRRFLDVDSISSKLSVPVEHAPKMITHMLDFFRLFAATQAFSCEQWIENLCVLVLELEAKWNILPPQIAPCTCTTACQGSCAGTCEGFRAPLCRLLAYYPTRAIGVIMEKSQSCSHHAELFSSILRCRHATGLMLEMQRQSSMFFCSANPASNSYVFDDTFSDVKFVVGPSREVIRAHRVVLATRSSYFCNMFTNGMTETSNGIVELPDVDMQSVRLLLMFIYNPCLNLGNQSPLDLMGVFALADRFVVDHLLRLCEHHLSSKVTWEIFFDLISIASQYMFPENTEKFGCLSPQHCGPFGESLLRACQIFLVSNLGSLGESIDLEHPWVSKMLCSQHTALMNANHTALKLSAMRACPQLFEMAVQHQLQSSLSNMQLPNDDDE
jgi:hypothetical protein